MRNRVDTEGPLDELVRGIQKCTARDDASIVNQEGDLKKCTNLPIKHLPFPFAQVHKEGEYVICSQVAQQCNVILVVKGTRACCN